MQRSAYSKHHHDEFHGEPIHGEGYYDKGKGMLNKQGIENADTVYDNFTNNIDKIPQELKDLVIKYNMGTAKDTEMGINISDNPQVTATTLILPAEPYPNIVPIIYQQIKNPGLNYLHHK